MNCQTICVADACAASAGPYTWSARGYVATPPEPSGRMYSSGPPTSAPPSLARSVTVASPMVPYQSAPVLSTYIGWTTRSDARSVSTCSYRTSTRVVWPAGNAISHISQSAPNPACAAAGTSCRHERSSRPSTDTWNARIACGENRTGASAKRRPSESGAAS